MAVAVAVDADNAAAHLNCGPTESFLFIIIGEGGEVILINFVMQAHRGHVATAIHMVVDQAVLHSDIGAFIHLACSAAEHEARSRIISIDTATATIHVTRVRMHVIASDGG